ncbi:MAG: DUF2380 domain-containing protein [Gammaproteobacteria bacterium]|nr:DUF2380 domain-containing protein [Gammaproteobacteria bacterium]
MPPTPVHGNSATRRCRLFATLLLFATLAPAAPAHDRIAVIDFELRNLTPLADTDDDRRQLKKLRSGLERALAAQLGMCIVDIDRITVQRADAGFGYLFEHADVAAQLGARYGADWIVIGFLHKPSFLFSYLMVRLVDTHSGEVAEDIVVEVKGQRDVVMDRGIEHLVAKLRPRLLRGMGSPAARASAAADSHARTACEAGHGAQLPATD